MSTSVDIIKKIYPIPAYNFKVRLGPEYYSFAQVSGLNLQYDTITYRHGLSWLEGDIQIPGIQQAITVTLERGIVKHGSQFWNWIQSIQLGSVFKLDIFIDLCDEKGDPTVTWAVRNAFPTQLEAPSFDANSNDVAIERLQLMANGLKVEYHS